MQTTGRATAAPSSPFRRRSTRSSSSISTASPSPFSYGPVFAGFTLSFPFIGGSVTIIGDATTPANVIINSGIVVQNGATIAIGGVEFRANGHCIDVLTAGTIIINRKVNFGPCGGFHLLAESAGGNIVIALPAGDGGYVINGPAGYGHFGASTGGISW